MVRAHVGLRRVGAMLAMVMAMSLIVATPAAGAEVLSVNGKHGDYGTLDTIDQPGGRCGYGAENSSGVARLRWVRLFPVFAWARDRTSGVDQQTVSMQLIVQRSTGGTGGPWQRVARSADQKRTAADNVSAEFDPIRLYVNGRANEYFRAIAVIKWWRNGAVEGWARIRIEFYSNKWTVGAPDHVAQDYCTGAAD